MTPGPRETSAARGVWILLAYGDERQNAANLGYEDSYDKYTYDSLVPNHKRLQVGDVVLIAGRERRSGPPALEGMAIIAHIDVAPGTKTIGRCPVCGKPRFKLRLSKSPLYRCDTGHEFDEPSSTTVAVTKFTAWYGGSYRRVEGVSVSALRQAQANAHDGNAIRPANPAAAAQLLIQHDVGAAAEAEVGPAYADPARARVVEEFAVRFVATTLHAERPELEIRVMPHNHPGYDIELLVGDEVTGYVEVKGLTGPRPAFFLTEFERAFAQRHSTHYELFVVCGAASPNATPVLYRHRGDYEDGVVMKTDRWAVLLAKPNS